MSLLAIIYKLFVCRLWLKIACAIAVLAWIFNLYPWMWVLRWYYEVPPVSYDGRIHFNLNNLQKPSCEDDIIKIVKDAYTSDPVQKIRVLGDGHSWSEIAQTPDIMVSLVNYQGLVNIDKDASTATLRAGTPLSKASELLEAEGYAMLNLGSVAGQSIAGAISTGTHGTGLTVGNLAEFVTALKFVSGTGTVHYVSREDNNTDLFKAAQVSIGMLGILMEVTIHVEELFYLEENRTSQYDLDYCINNLDSLVDSAKYVKMWVEFYNDLCVLFQTDVTEQQIATPVPWWEPLFTYYSFAITTRITYLIPSLTPYTNWLVGYIGFKEESHRIDISYKIFNDYFDLPIHQEGEVIVPYESAADTIKTVKNVVLENNLPVNYITEIRFVKGDDIWLSPEYDTRSCAITLTIFAKNEVALNYFNLVYQDTVEAYGARIHWGKHFTANNDQIKKWYPKFPQFLLKRKEMDPKGIFLNEFLEQTFLEAE